MSASMALSGYPISLGLRLSISAKSAVFMAVLVLHVLVPWLLAVMHAHDQNDDPITPSHVLEVSLTPLLAASEPTGLESTPIHADKRHTPPQIPKPHQSTKNIKRTEPSTVQTAARESSAIAPKSSNEIPVPSSSASASPPSSESQPRDQARESHEMLSPGVNHAGVSSPTAQPLSAPPRYASGPPRPLYPRLSQRLGEEGTVWLRIRINALGDVEQVEIRQSSGFQLLDEAAATEFKRTRYIPARMNGVAVAQTVDVRVRFRLDEAPSVN